MRATQRLRVNGWDIDQAHCSYLPRTTGFRSMGVLSFCDHATTRVYAPVLTCAVTYLTAMSSTSKRSVALGGISGGEPFLPYPSLGGMTSLRLPPTLIPAMPLSQPLMTSPAPSVKWNLDAASNSVPSSNVPRYFIVTSLPASAIAPPPAFSSSTVTCSSAGAWNSTPLTLNDCPFCSRRPPSTPVLSAFLTALGLSTPCSRLRNLRMACLEEPVGSAKRVIATSILSRTVFGALVGGTLVAAAALGDLGGMLPRRLLRLRSNRPL
mmetsp:Transcript_47201/g.75571  ORF Transcript_47201/g.75571 Transcript_47201/m.75571 type:complete len:266 (-) Transcript_47201:1-798(-)